MNIERTPIEGLVLIEPPRFHDERGFFSEVFNARKLAAHGLETDFVQDNQSLSMQRGTVRGLHYQSPPSAQAKLVRCGRGAVWDVAVDVRRGSPTFGCWFGAELTAENARQLLIPVGFLHGFSTLTDEAELLYKCSDFYDASTDGAVRFDSTALAIDWRLGGAHPVLSEKDEAAPNFEDWESPFLWEAP